MLSDSDILVFPSKIDVFGIVNLEAMQHGLAVISTNISAIPDIVEDGVTGFLVDTDAPDQIADKLEILLNNPSLCYEMGVKGRKKYEESFTLEKFEKKLTEVLKAAI
jgi:glycosyltransferase involved in cell wall biosynthesis